MVASISQAQILSRQKLDGVDCSNDLLMIKVIITLGLLSRMRIFYIGALMTSRHGKREGIVNCFARNVLCIYAHLIVQFIYI
jgi:hypothetical protein